MRMPLFEVSDDEVFVRNGCRVRARILTYLGIKSVKQGRDLRIVHSNRTYKQISLIVSGKRCTSEMSQFRISAYLWN
ncbi:hypothetical protein TNCT_349661 [Trichonephila clavata]|uniref:Uncharacterized protein n=1 Tax=Trichonephila clavata TaxID=2740835 RepID=A0A8X6K5I4_TRICU|nr:hypothetical protein TNCT_349661 [Trichonephila clavata]